MAEVRLDQAALDRLLRSPDGPVGRALLNEGRILTNEAKQACPVDEGRLRSSIAASLVPTAQGLAVEVGSPLEYAAYVETGTRPHFPPIIAVSGWTRRHGGGSPFLVARAIAQRGTKANRYLAGPLLRRHPGARLWATYRG